ncbi:hypothetical protein EZV62_027617 [Acer yangbiense]|uniref:Cytochrome P450 n=1 Tax=Acer yangbiense TaxID=1000413 RepID=A0A5C7GUH8_9ROSI|nr:hypothetical protein EZV62_027617 [Acer yangbiense]
MELFIFFGLIIFTLFVSVSLAYLLSSKLPENLPPGKLGWPYIGESLEYLKTARKGHPEKFIFDRTTKYSSQLFKTSILAEPTVFVCGASANKFLFSNDNKLVDIWFPESLKKLFPATEESSPDKESKKQKMMLSNFLKTESLMRYINMMDSIAQKHFEYDWEEKQQVTVFPLAKKFTFWVACKVFLSIEDPQHMAKLANTFSVLASGLFSIPVNIPGTTFNRAIKAAKEIRKELIVIIKQRKTEASPTPQDLLSHLLLETDENGQHMTESYIAERILGLLVAGHETLTSAITSIVKYLADLPHIYNQVLKEQMKIAKSKKEGELLEWDDIKKMKYSWNVACEAMRVAPPVLGAYREAINDFIFLGFSIPKGWKLYWSMYSTHLNPECFPEPEKFDPTRFEGNGPAPYTFVPFGGGARMCPGQEYARLEILVFMHNLIKRFKWDKLLPHEKTIVKPGPTPAKGLPIRLLPHNHSI